jgi:hypothetical protein
MVTPKFATAVTARPWEAAVAALDADPEATLVDGAQAPVINAHLALPLLPQLASLFLCMPHIWRAFKITQGMRSHRSEPPGGVGQLAS